MKPRRFRLTRRVPDDPHDRPASGGPESPLPAEGDADPGSPEMDRAVRAGCTSFIKVVGLFFLLMALSIILTCAIKKPGV